MILKKVIPLSATKALGSYAKGFSVSVQAGLPPSAFTQSCPQGGKLYGYSNFAIDLQTLGF